MNPKKQNPARARCGAVAGSHSGAKSTDCILAQRCPDVNAGFYGGWDTFGEYLDWFEREVMGFDDAPDLRGAPC